jgi:hypothetical protein
VISFSGRIVVLGDRCVKRVFFGFYMIWMRRHVFMFLVFATHALRGQNEIKEMRGAGWSRLVPGQKLWPSRVTLTFSHSFSWRGFSVSQQLREVLSRSFDVVYGPFSEVYKDTERALETARAVVRSCAFQRGRILAAEITVIHPWAVLDYVKHH